VELLKKHREHDADITIATHSVGWGQATRRGLTRVDPNTGDSQITILDIVWSILDRLSPSCQNFPTTQYVQMTRVCVGGGGINPNPLSRCIQVVARVPI
jgi:hypothetical protein